MWCLVVMMICMVAGMVDGKGYSSTCVSQVVLITGASQGIGLATARYLAEQGHIVCAGVRKTSSRKELEQLQKKFLGSVMIVEIDVIDQQTIDASIQKILQGFGRIDVLVNNACTVILGPVETQTLEEQKIVMDVNYFGPVRMIQAVAPVMRKQEHGYIINISSVAGISPTPFLESYTTSKYALEGLSESLVTNLAPWNIHVSVIEVGPVRTTISEKIVPGSRTIASTKCFDTYNKTTLAFMRRRLDVKQEVSDFVEPIDIARCIGDIIVSTKPHVRYQVGDVAKIIAGKRFKDVTGDSYVRDLEKLYTERGFAVRDISS